MTSRRLSVGDAAAVLFAGAGEMRTRCRALDWSATPLGPVERWPQSLRTVVGTVLASAFPSIVLWGPDLVQIYNDGYIPFLGVKHPWGLGIPTRVCWPEVWHINEPIYLRVSNGETISREDALYPLARNGPDAPLDDVYITLSYSPIPDEAGEVGGVLVTLFETTQRVTMRRLEAEREQLHRELEVERARLMEVFRQAPAFMAVVRGPSYIFELANDAYYQLVGHRDIIGKPALEALPELRGQGFIELVDAVIATGVPFVGRELPLVIARTPGSPPEQRFADFVYQPLIESDGTRSGIVAHGSDVTEHVRARQEIERLLAASEQTRLALQEANAQLEDANVQLEEQQLELETANQQLQDNALELESQTEELQTTAAALGERTEAAERSTERTARLQALTAALAQTLTPEDVATVIVTRAVEATGASTGTMALRTVTGDAAEIVRQTGLPPDVAAAWHGFPLSAAGPAAACIRAGEPIWLESRAALDARFPLPEVWDRMGTSAIATVPLVIGSETVGAMSFTFREPREFAAEDREFFLTLAQQAAQALERARLIAAESAAIATLRDRDARLNFAMDIAALGAWDLDLTTQRAWRSLRHDQIFGFESLLPEWTYEMFLRHVVPEDQAHVNDAFGTALANQTSWDFTCRIRRADGAERWITGRGEHALDAEGRPTRLLGVVRDITAEKDAERALRTAKEEAEAANRTKSDFLATMSHELRTPLNAIGGYTELLALGIRGAVTEQQQADLARIKRSQQHLLGLINDLLNVVRLDAGRLQYDITDVPLGSAMARVEELILPQLHAKGLSYEHVACDPSLAVRADEEKLRQVLVNVLTNAIKFTDAGGVALWTEARGQVVHIHVRDTGTGIPLDQLDKIFEPFVQVGRRLNRPAEGVGLGLAISRDLARGMHGDLTVESDVDAGSTFTLTLPRATDSGHESL